MPSSLRPVQAIPRAVLAALFACALLARLAVPAGWMPVRDGAGLRFAPCTGIAPPAASAAGHHAMPAHGEHSSKHDPQPERREQPCAFAGLASAAIGGGHAAPLPAPPALHALAPAPLPPSAALPGLAAPPPPSTGPPLPA